MNQIRNILRKIPWTEIGAYLGAIAACLVMLAWVMRLWEADLEIPFTYSEDGLQTSMLIKGLIDNGWFQHNIFIGLPGGQDLSDYPINDYLDFIILKFISIITPNYAVTMNTYYLLTFPLTTVTAMFVFRQFNVSHGSSIFGGLLYAFLPYHFLRNEMHLGLAAYYMIPLIILVILWLCEGKSLIVNSNNQLKWDLLGFHSLISIVICILVSYTFIYYSFFSCFFLLIAGITTYISQRNKSFLLNSFVLISIIVIGALVSTSPTLIYQYENGKNPEVAARSPAESEVYGLKIAQLLMPVGGHRIPLLASISNRYSSTAPLPNEGSETLGMVGSIGFLLLIALAFYRMTGGSNLKSISNELNGLSTLNLSAILLATIGGFGSLFSYLISSQIRCYNRISIFIAFFSLFAFVVLIEMLKINCIKTKRAQFFYYGLILLVLVVGVLDQTTANFIPPYALTKAEYLNDEIFVNDIEAIMPGNAMIFQLPYVPFPEYPPVNRMSDYSLLKAYLHSKDLRWSYGAMKGRPGDDWQRMVASMPVGDMLKTLSSFGFEGIYIDRHGFEDGGAKLISDIKQILGTELLVSGNKRLYFFDMTTYNQKIKANSSENKIITTAFASGWYGQEKPHRWMQEDGAVFVSSDQDCIANLSLQTFSFYRPRTLVVYSGDELAVQVDLPVSLINVSVPIYLAKGANTVRLHVPEGCDRPSDKSELNNPDSRCLSVAVQNLTVT